ncbi:hypothetical protein ApDm4_2696 [Acetobacter pomorum]|nr:hypothetical protein ApDm4_2696 [Acetobacter pomorum]
MHLCNYSAGLHLLQPAEGSAADISLQLNPEQKSRSDQADRLLPKHPN